MGREVFDTRTAIVARGNCTWWTSPRIWCRSSTEQELRPEWMKNRLRRWKRWSLPLVERSAMVCVCGKCSVDICSAEVRPQRVREMEFRISGLPEQEVA